MAKPRLSVVQILAWADAHHERTGRWPAARRGTVAEAPGLTWGAVDRALRRGLPGLPAGGSLARLLARHRGHRYPLAAQPLSEALILGWADGHHTRTGRWPGAHSGPVADTPGEHWGAINAALHNGLRGLPGGDSLARLLVRRGRRPGLWARSGPGAWTPAEDELVRTLSPKDAARHTGRQLTAVYMRRCRLGVPKSPGRKK
jgi:hypothetical protein